MKKGSLRFVQLSLVAATLLGCVGNQLDRSFAAGQYLEVARLFEADSALQRQERALYRAGLVYALPESPAYSPERALETFDRLIELYPETRYRPHVAHLQQLLREFEEERAVREAQEAQIEKLTEELAEERERLVQLENDLASATVRADALETINERLRRDIAASNERIQALAEELAALKEIDLNRPTTPPAAERGSGTVR